MPLEDSEFGKRDLRSPTLTSQASTGGQGYPEMNLPTVLTLSRPVLVVPIIAILMAGGYWSTRWAAILFGIGILTDFLDGFLARRLDQASPLGRFLDPLCDKIFVYSIAFFFAAIGTISLMITLLIFARDLVVDGIRRRSAKSGKVLQANRWGKIKFILQGLALAISFFAISSPGGTLSGSIANLILFAAFLVSLPGVVLLVRESKQT